MTAANPIENLVSANKAAVENVTTIANGAIANAERLAALNLNTARSLMEDSVANVKAMLGAKDPQQFVALQSTLVQPFIEKFVAYSRSVYEIAADSHEDVSKIVEAQVAEVSKTVSDVLDKATKNAPAGTEGAIAAVKSAIAAANAAYENINKATKQAVEMTEANVAAATAKTVKAVGAATKAKKSA